jgi:alpha-beta hydrolase superfamily lysophospholipase
MKKKITIQEHSRASATQGVTLHIQHWALEAPRAVIALVHGQGEHIGRYAHMAEWMGAQGIAMMGHDQQGFGKSGGKRGHAPGLEAYLDDIAILIEEAQGRYPGVPIILYGHSMGGNVVLNYVFRRPIDVLTGVIVSGPWVRLAFEAPGWKVALGRLLGGLWPELSLSTELDVKKLSRDPQVVAAYKADPLTHDRMSASAGVALIDAAAWLNTYSGKVSRPLLMMHGGADGLTSASATRELAERLSGQVMHHEWKGLYHEIHNEPEQQEVFQFVLDWVDNWI